MLFKIVIFILFLGPLVFFHELGHFLFARLFGVRVEVFSIGFGPKLLKKRWGDTEYAFSLIPLGGYVKMYGENLLEKDEIPEDQREFSFNHKGKLARFWIVFGGPLANFILATIIYFLLSLSGETAPEVRLGVISDGSPLYSQGFRAGDVMLKVNGHKILSPVDFPMEQEHTVDSVVVKRGNKEITLKPAMEVQKFFKAFMSTPPLLRSPLVVDAKGKRWGLSWFNSGVLFDSSIDRMAYEYHGRKLYLFPVTSESDEKGVFKYDKLKYKGITFPSEGDSKLFFKTLAEQGFYPVDLMVKSVSMDSAADKAKMQGKDIIVSLNGHSTYSFEDLRFYLKQSKEKNVDIEYIRDGQKTKLTLTPQVKEIGGVERKLIGVFSGGEFLPIDYIEVPGKGVFESVPLAFIRTWNAIDKTFSGFKKLITAQVSLKAVGGPLSIGKVAAESFQTSLSYFFQIMALISVNLGVINLFPIPVLDGGHIVFIILETINRGPLSRRKLEIAQQFGLSILLLLMVAALFNDFTRFFS